MVAMLGRVFPFARSSECAPQVLVVTGECVEFGRENNCVVIVRQEIIGNLVS
jgi:hypothetical protein